MTITLTALTRAAGAGAAAAGVIFIGVQINHPELDAISIATTAVYPPAHAAIRGDIPRATTAGVE